jgi:ribosomal subunit interface protein
MQEPLQITFRNMAPSESIEAAIRERAEKLGSYCDNIISCQIVVKAPHRHQQKGGLYHVRIDIGLTGESIQVNRTPDLHRAHEDVYVAIRDAFNAARRQLQEYVSRLKGRIKPHAEAPRGRISKLFPEQDYGRITTSDGGDIYFHRNSVLNADLDSLEIGTEVRFVEQEGDEGPQASSVRVIGRHPPSG